MVLRRNSRKSLRIADPLFKRARDEALEMASFSSGGIIGSFDLERLKRSRFQYEMTEEVKRGKAGASLERAKRFVFELEKLLVK